MKQIAHWEFLYASRCFTHLLIPINLHMDAIQILNTRPEKRPSVQSLCTAYTTKIQDNKKIHPSHAGGGGESPIFNAGPPGMSQKFIKQKSVTAEVKLYPTNILSSRQKNE